MNREINQEKMKKIEELAMQLLQYVKENTDWDMMSTIIIRDNFIEIMGARFGIPLKIED